MKKTAHVYLVLRSGMKMDLGVQDLDFLPRVGAQQLFDYQGRMVRAQIREISQTSPPDVTAFED
jgi:hypothetical protein